MENSIYLLLFLVLILLSLIMFIVTYITISKKSNADLKNRYDELNKNINSFELNITNAINQNSQSVAKILFDKLTDISNYINRIDSDNTKFLENIKDVLNNQLQESNNILKVGLNNIDITLKETISIQ